MDEITSIGLLTILFAVVPLILLFLFGDKQPCEPDDTECLQKQAEEAEKRRKRQEEWDKPFFEKTPWQKTKFIVGNLFIWIGIIFLVIMAIAFLASIGPFGRAAMTWG